MLPSYYIRLLTPQDARCGFRDFPDRQAGRQDAYLSASDHLPGGNSWHASTGCRLRRLALIHTAEVEPAIGLRWVLSDDYLTCQTDRLNRRLADRDTFIALNSTNRAIIQTYVLSRRITQSI
jgi:hypothetical protein